MFCGRARWAPPRFLFFRLLLFLYGYLAGASVEEGGVWTSLTCHTSPPPNPWGAHLSPLRVVCRLAQPPPLLWHAIKENGNHQNDFQQTIEGIIQ